MSAPRDADLSALDVAAEAAHDAWLAEKRRRGVTTWPSETGEEQLVPWAVLSEPVRDFDRIVVRAILNAVAPAPRETAAAPRIDVEMLAKAIRSTDLAVVDLRTGSQILSAVSAPLVAAEYERLSGESRGG